MAHAGNPRCSPGQVCHTSKFMKAKVLVDVQRFQEAKVTAFASG